MFGFVGVLIILGILLLFAAIKILPEYQRGVVLTLVDYLGLLTDATEATSDSAVATNVKSVLEHLTLLTLLRRTVDAPGGPSPQRVLLLKDGSLMLRGQCTRLVGAIRGYLRHLDAAGMRFHLAGIDREGSFVNHCGQVEAGLAEPGTIERAKVLLNVDTREDLPHLRSALISADSLLPEQIALAEWLEAV